jgi:hypothetical protein
MCFVVNVFREIFETKLGTIGNLMRLVEVMSLGAYNLGMIMSLNNISVFIYWAMMKNKYPEFVHDMR